MLSRISVLGLAAMGLLAFGCSKSNDPGATQATPPAGSIPANAASVPAAPLEDVKVVVGRFLEALRTGDSDAAEKLLTKAAREKIAGTDLKVAPPPNETRAVRDSGRHVSGPGDRPRARPVDRSG